TVWCFRFGDDLDAHQHHDGRSHTQTVKPMSSERASRWFAPLGSLITLRAVGIAEVGSPAAGGLTQLETLRVQRLGFNAWGSTLGVQRLGFATSQATPRLRLPFRSGPHRPRFPTPQWPRVPEQPCTPGTLGRGVLGDGQVLEMRPAQGKRN